MRQTVRYAVSSHHRATIVMMVLVVHGRRGRRRCVLLLIRRLVRMVLVHHLDGHHGLVRICRPELVQIHHAAHIIAFGEKLFRVYHAIGHQVLFDIARRATSRRGARLARVELVQIV